MDNGNVRPTNGVTKMMRKCSGCCNAALFSRFAAVLVVVVCGQFVLYHRYLLSDDTTPSFYNLKTHITENGAKKRLGATEAFLKEFLSPNVTISRFTKRNTTTTTMSTKKIWPNSLVAKGQPQTIKTIKTTKAYIESFRSNFGDLEDGKHRFRPLAFIHVPKAGGTSIEDVAAVHHIYWGACVFPRSRNLITKRCPIPQYGQHDRIHNNLTLTGQWPSRPLNFWHFPRELFPLANIDPYRNTETFIVTRDVYTRMVSEFYWYCSIWKHDRCEMDRLYDPKYMNEWIRNKIRQHHQEESEGRKLGFGRYSFILADYEIRNGHFIPQYEFAVAPNDVRMTDHVLHLENMTAEFDQLVQSYAYDGLHLRGAAQHVAPSELKTKKLSVEHLDENTTQILNDVFSADYWAFGYQMRD